MQFLCICFEISSVSYFLILIFFCSPTYQLHRIAGLLHFRLLCFLTFIHFAQLHTVLAWSLPQEIGYQMQCGCSAICRRVFSMSVTERSTVPVSSRYSGCLSLPGDSFQYPRGKQQLTGVTNLQLSTLKSQYKVCKLYLYIYPLHKQNMNFGWLCSLLRLRCNRSTCYNISYAVDPA